MSKNEMNADKREERKSSVATAIAVIAILIAAGAAFFGVKYYRENQAKQIKVRSEKYSGYTFNTDAMTNVKDVRWLTDGLLVYTLNDGMMGLMAPDGTRATEAIYTDVNVYETGFMSYVYTAMPKDEVYPRIIRTGQKKVDIKQYQGGEDPDYYARWDSTAGKLMRYDIMGTVEEITPLELMLDMGLYPVANGVGNGAKWGYIDENLTLAIDTTFDGALPFSEGLAPVFSSGRWGYIDETGNLKINHIYENCAGLSVAGGDFCFGFVQGVAPVKKDGVMGLVDKNGKLVAEFAFDVILQGENGKYIAKRDGDWGVVTLDSLPAEETVVHTDATTSPSQLRGTFVVSTEGASLMMRSQPSTEASVVIRVPNGSKVTVSKTSGEWAYAKYYTYEGWMAVKYLEFSEAETETEVQ